MKQQKNKQKPSRQLGEYNEPWSRNEREGDGSPESDKASLQ